MMANDAVQEGIDRGIGLVEGTNDQNITSEDYMRYYTAVYNICFPSNLHESQQLCDQYKKVFEEYINSKVLPSLRGKEDEPYVTRTSKKVVKPQSLGRFFHYLDRYFTVLRRLPSLKETSFSCFYKLVFSEVNDKVKNAVFSMFDHVGDAIFQNDREWEGEQINQALVKNVIDIYMEMGMGSVEFYEKDFEQAMLEEATAFYSQ